MTKAELIDLLNGAKALSSQVDIDKMIDLLNDLDGTSESISESALEEFITSVENRLDRLSSEDVVQYSTAEFELDSCNMVSLIHVDADLSEIGSTVRDLMIEQFEITAE